MIDDRYEPFREYLYQEMERRNWSLCYLAQVCGLSHGTVSCFLNHVRAPSIAFFEKIADGLGVPVLDLLALGGIVPPVPPAVRNERRLLMAYRALPLYLRPVLVNIAEAMQPEGGASGEIERLIEGLSDHDLDRVRALIQEVKHER